MDPIFFSVLSQNNLNVGVISDTHGLLRQEVVSGLAACQLIIHAGDIGSLAILHELQRIAPTLAILGNNDKDPWTTQYSTTEQLSIGGVSTYIIHNLQELVFNPEDKGIQLVISGHTHRPRVQRQNNVLYVNPGSAGPRRFSLPIAMAKVKIANGKANAHVEILG